MNEFSMIAEYFAPLAPGGLKDDAAVLKIPPGQELVVTSDTLNAGTHFMAGAAPGDIAHKALRVNLSDLAAMGASPLSYQLNIAFQEKPSTEWLAAFTGALAADQKEFNIFCSGGDTTLIKGSLSISITALGLVPAGKAVTRGGAKPGDRVVLTGPMGEALIGLKILRGEIQSANDLYFIQKYYQPRPRLDLADFMRAHAHAAIDISDGLIADLGHVCAASGLRAALQIGESVFSPQARAVLAAGQVTMEQLLTGGDDYQLLLAVPGGVTLPEGACVIGAFAAGEPGVAVRDTGGAVLTFSHKGWTHF